MIPLDICEKLAPSFDPGRLSHDLEIAMKEQFSKHPLQYHDGSWETINLIYAGGKLEYTHEGDHGFGNEPPARTELLDRCPYFDEVLSSFPGRIKMARLSALPAGGRILRHYDPIESVDFDNMRLHIPIVTSDDVVFRLALVRRRWRAGETWYGDFTFPHSVHNRGTQTRVHLILDIEVDAEAIALLPPGYMDEQRKARRARHRKRFKDISWYLTRAETLLGRHGRRAPAS